MISVMTGCQVISSLPPSFRVELQRTRCRDLLRNVLLHLMPTSSPPGSVISSASQLLLRLGLVTASGTLMSPADSSLERAAYFVFSLILISG